MLERLRSGLYSALSSPAGNRVLPIRLARSAALYVNDVVGRPLATGDELSERREFEQRKASGAAAPAEPKPVDQAPIIVFHREKHRVEVGKIQLLLDGEKLSYQVQNIEGDEAAIAATLRDGKGYKLPIVFIAGQAVGGRSQLATMIQNGELTRLAFPRS
jgi:hypothetical protein